MATTTLMPDPGVALGVNLDAAPHQVPEGFGRFLKDVLLDTPGIVRQRGNVHNINTQFPGLPNSSVWGITSLADPNGSGTFRLCVAAADRTTGVMHFYVYGFTSTAAAPFAMKARSFFELQEPLNVGPEQFLGDPFLRFDGRRAAQTTVTGQLLDFTHTVTIPVTSQPYPFFQAQMCQDGGVLISVGTQYGYDVNAGTHRSMVHWRGAAKTTSGNTATLTQNSAVLTNGTASFLTQVEPGMFVMRQSDNFPIGVIKSVDSNTQVTLEQNTPLAGSIAVWYKAFREPYVVNGVRLGAGSITTSTTSAIVNGGGTKFVDQGVSAGQNVLRASDMTLVGVVQSVQANEQLTLTGNAGFALSGEDYFITAGAPWAAGRGPAFSAYWNNIQLLANADNNRNGRIERSRIFVTDPLNMDVLDLTKTGTFYDLPNTKPHTDIRGLFPTESACLVFLSESTYGLYGNDPSALSPKVIYDDGCLSPMTVQAWQGGAVWTGHRGVYWFDGSTVHNLLNNRALLAHKRAVEGLDYSTIRAYSMLHNGHYIVWLSKVNQGNFTHHQAKANSTDTPGNVQFDPDSIAYCINLQTGALVFWTNVQMRGYTAPPGQLVDNTRDAYWVSESVAGTVMINSAAALFQEAGETGSTTDDTLLAPVASGTDFAPHFFVEGRLNAYGDPERLKRGAMLLAQYSLYGGNVNSLLGIDVIRNLAGTVKTLGSRSATSPDVSNPVSWTNKRVRFSTKFNELAVRYYTMADGQPAAARLGPWSVGVKPMRPGRV